MVDPSYHPDDDLIAQDKNNPDFLSYVPERDEEWPSNYISDSDYSSTHLPSSEFSDSLSERDLSEARRLGRRRLPETDFLEGYRTIRSNRPPKKENLRIQLFRGFVKLVESLSAGKTLSQRINAFFGVDFSAYKSALEDLKSFLFDNWDQVRAVVEKSKTPKAAGLSSYSDAFFKMVLDDEVMKVGMGLYLEFVFSDCSEGVMERRLNLVSCRTKLADQGVSHWDKLRNYFKEQLFTDAKEGNQLSV